MLLTTAVGIQPGNAQPSSPSADLAETIVFEATFEPPGDDSPSRTSGVGSRDGGQCALEEQPVQALMPQGNFGLTLAERPTVAVQLPDKTSAQRLILTVMDETGLYFAERDFFVAGQTGVISLSLSDQAPALTIGPNYQWHVVVVCGEQVEPDNPVLAGWVQRAGATESLDQKSTLEQVQWLAANGYWYDMVRILKEELRSHPDDPDLKTVWQSVVLSQLQ